MLSYRLVAAPPLLSIAMPAGAPAGGVIPSTTTPPPDSGLPHLPPPGFSRAPGRTVQTTAGGTGATLGLADDRRAYTLTDRATLLAFGKRLGLRIMVEGDRRLRNVYSVMETNPANGPRVNAAGGRAFADFMVSRDAQEIVRAFGVDRYGRPLFVPNAGQREEEIE